MLDDAAALLTLFKDDNPQNKNAANAGDGPKHAAWLACLHELGPRLEWVLETHAGAGIYDVPDDAFCVGLPEESILGRHQRSAALPAAAAGRSLYSASGDQTLLNLRPEARYVAFDKSSDTSRRLGAVAEFRGKRAQLDARPMSFRGNGDSRTGIEALFEGCDPARTLLMVDPFGSGEFDPARLALQSGISTVVFGAKDPRDTRFDAEWSELLRAAKAMHRIYWLWSGLRALGESSAHVFHLLVAMPSKDELERVYQALRREDAVFIRQRQRTHQFITDIDGIARRPATNEG